MVRGSYRLLGSIGKTAFELSEHVSILAAALRFTACAFIGVHHVDTLSKTKGALPRWTHLPQPFGDSPLQ